MSVKQFWQDFQELLSEKEKQGIYGYLQLFVAGNNINQRINSK